MIIKNIPALIKSSNSGNFRSKALLAFAYWSGNSVKQDFKKAFKIWMELANIDDPNGLFNIATMYMRGDGMKIDYKKSHKYHKMRELKNKRISFMWSRRSQISNKKLKLYFRSEIIFAW